MLISASDATQLEAAGVTGVEAGIRCVSWNECSLWLHTLASSNSMAYCVSAMYHNGAVVISYKRYDLLVIGKAIANAMIAGYKISQLATKVVDTYPSYEL